MNKASELDSALGEFASEGMEILERVSEGLQSIEKGNVNSELVSAIYRDMHTLKGTTQLFGFHEMGKVAHALEASLDPIRKHNVAISSRLLEGCFKGLDLLDRMLKVVLSTKTDAEFQHEVVEVISGLIDSAANQFEAELGVFKEGLVLNDVKKMDSTNSKIKMPEKNVQDAMKPMEHKMTESAKDVDKNNLGVQSSSVTQGTTIVSQQQQTSSSSQTSNNSGTSVSALADTSGVSGDASIRVQVSLLDGLMNLVGELVLVRNQFLQYRNKNEETVFLGLSKNLDVVTSELQSEVMKTRMQPIGNVLSKFQRIVRDISRDLNKRIDLTIEGAETELDKTLLEAIKDPLTHIVRNSCDHGIENIEERRTAGKPETGHLLIRSFHEGGQVVVEISDDGKGLNRNRIVSKAIERGILTQEQATQLQDREICNLIFTPGFSTAKEVTSVSGRGVGMDVVKTNIEKIGGTVELNSIFGRGTTIRLKIPLTLAIVPAMLVKSGNERFAIPQVKLVELVRIEADQSKNGVEYLQGRPMYRLRGALLSLIDIKEITGEQGIRASGEAINIVVLNAEGEVFGLIVDEILDTADIVVKPLGSFLKYLSIFSGATIMGDGSIALILDVIGMAQASKIDTKKERIDDSALISTSSGLFSSADQQDYLIFSLDTGVVHAIPLCLVQRLEEFKSKDVELSGEQRVVRYRKSLLPLINLRSVLKYEKKSSGDSKEFVSVIVVQRSGRNFGIEVSEILDVISGNENIDDTICDRPGILGNIIYNDSVITVIDALSLIENSVPQLQKWKGNVYSSKNKSSLEEIRTLNRGFKNKKIRILFAEDVAFFRRHVMKVLTDAGCEVTTYEDGAKALDALLNSPGDKFNLILSDIEMPNMTGLEFAKEVRRIEKFKDLPMIALTTRFRDSDIEAGINAGFNAYLEKLNPEKLLKAMEELMGVSFVEGVIRE